MNRKLHQELRELERRLEGSRRQIATDGRAWPGHAADLVKAGDVYLQAERPEEAVTALEEAIEIYRRLADPSGELRALTGLSVVLRTQERFSEAAATYRLARALAVKLGWADRAEQLDLRILAVEAAERAGIDVPDGLIAAALTAENDQSWVYEIDRSKMTGTSAPPEAIIKGWQVGPDRLLTGLVVPNPDYRPGKRQWWRRTSST